VDLSLEFGCVRTAGLSFILVQDRYKHMSTSSVLRTSIATVGPTVLTDPVLGSKYGGPVTVKQHPPDRNCHYRLSPIRYFARNMADLSLEFGLVWTAGLSFVLVQDTCAFC
jgi:hypothetical protein